VHIIVRPIGIIVSVLETCQNKTKKHRPKIKVYISECAIAEDRKICYPVLEQFFISLFVFKSDRLSPNAHSRTKLTERKNILYRIILKCI